MIRNETTVLRAPEESDAQLLTDLRNDLTIQRQLLARPRPNSRERVWDWVNRLGADPTSAFFVIASARDGSAVGFLQVTEMNFIDGNGRLGLAIHPSCTRRGHARAAIQLVGGYLKDVFALRKLVLDVSSDNVSAVALYRSLGFREVGVWKEHHRVGDGYVDVIAMEVPLSQ